MQKLAVIPEERIDELLVRITGAANFSQSPFPESSGFVTGFFEYFEDGVGAGRKGYFIIRVYTGIATDAGISSVHSGYQATTGRGADGRS